MRRHERLPADKWLGVPIPHDFYIEPRRLVGNQPALRDLYVREVLFDNPAETDHLIGRGILNRIVRPSLMLRGGIAR